MLLIDYSCGNFLQKIPDTTIEIRHDSNGFFFYNMDEKIYFSDFSIFRETKNSNRIFLFTSTNTSVILYEIFSDHAVILFKIENSNCTYNNRKRNIFKYITFEIEGMTYTMFDELVPAWSLAEKLPPTDTQFSFSVSKEQDTSIIRFDLIIRADCSVLKSVVIETSQPYESDMITVSLNLTN